MSETVFVVVKHGVYIQGIIGVFDSVEKAHYAANQAVINERDDYHTFHIVEFKLNKFEDY